MRHAATAEDRRPAGYQRQEQVVPAPADVAGAEKTAVLCRPAASPNTRRSQNPTTKHAPLDLLPVRKIGGPGHSELAVDAMIDGARPARSSTRTSCAPMTGLPRARAQGSRFTPFAPSGPASGRTAQSRRYSAPIITHRCEATPADRRIRGTDEGTGAFQVPAKRKKSAWPRLRSAISRSISDRSTRRHTACCA